MVLAAGVAPPLPTNSVSLNGTDAEALERFKIRELAEGFPCHRDACEWPKMRALFAAEDAYVFTTWSGGVPVDDFIKISEIGFSKGVKIAHRCNGCTVDVATSGPAAGIRGLAKLKATITQRFVMPTAVEGQTAEVDIDADCRLCFFVEKKPDGWKTHFFKGFYEKDKATPVDPRFVPKFDEEKLASFPEGYRYLAYGQSSAYKIKMDLPQSRGEAHDQFYQAFIDWLNGDSIEKMKVTLVPSCCSMPETLMLPHDAVVVDAEVEDREEPRASPYRLEYAKSGRSACKGRKPCGPSTLIRKGELRLGVIVQFGAYGDGLQFRHWGCVTERQLQKMAKEYQSADEIEGFEDLLDEDKLRVTQAFQNRQINIEDMSKLAPPRKGVVRAEAVEELEEPDLARAKGDDDFQGSATPASVPVRKPARKSRKQTAYTEEEELEFKAEADIDVDVDVKPKNKRGRASKTPKIEDTMVETDLEDVKPKLKKRIKSELPHASQTASGSRRVSKKQSAKKEDIDPRDVHSSGMPESIEEKKPKIKKERKVKEIQPGPLVDANGFAVRRSARHQQLKE
ncbi:hypothetical protein RQP46_000355 [Phenoliferia psychrophenolica]